MSASNTMRMAILTASLATITVAAVAQNQNQANQQPAQQQAQPQQQPQQKKSFWQKIQNMSQGAQNTMQNGTNTVQNTVQQGTSTVQGTMQNGTNVMQNGVQQVQNGAQQGAQGVQQGVPFGGGNGNAAFNGGGGNCGASCFDAGPFQANISQLIMSQQGGWHIIRMNVQFHNATNQPLAIAYHDGSMVMIDNNGNTYIPAGGNPGAVQGMGIDRGNQTDSQFVLSPGQTGNAMFSVARVRDNNSPVGTGYSYNFTIDELQAQNGAMAIPVRTYHLNVPSLSPSTVSSGASFPAAGSPANGYVGNGKGSAVGYPAAAATGYTGTSTTAPQGAVATQPGMVPVTQTRMVNGRPVTTTTYQAARPGATPVQQRMVNGRLVNVTPAPAVNNTGVNNAAMRSTVAPTATAVKAPIPAPAAKPTPVVTKTTTAAPAKKPVTAPR